MADRTLTVNGQPFTFNRDRFAGVRKMTSGHVYPPSIITQNSGSSSHFSATETNGSWEVDSTLGNDSTSHFGSLILVPPEHIRIGKNRVEFEITVNSGTIDNGASSINDRPLVFVARDYDDDPSTTAHSQIYEVFAGANTLDVEVFDDGVVSSTNFEPSLFLSARPSSVFNVTVSNIKVTHNYEEITVDRTADSGGRTMTVSEALGVSTTQIQVTVAGHANISGIYTKGIPTEFDWAQQGGDGRITREQTSQYNYEWKLLDNSDGAPSTLFGSGLVSETDSRPWNASASLPSSITITPVPDTLTVNRSSDRKGESRPLLSKVVGGAAAAYSLRDLNDKAGNNKVVRVRRASDNHERDFLAKEVSNGTLKNWVNTQVTAPLDIREIADSNSDGNNDGRVGNYLIAKAAYSLRSLGTRQATLAATGDTVARADGKFVCQVRRSTDDALKSFTADEVTDGTLLSFVTEAVSTLLNSAYYFSPDSHSHVDFDSDITLADGETMSLQYFLDGVTGTDLLFDRGGASTNSMLITTSISPRVRINGENVDFGVGCKLVLNTLDTLTIARSGNDITITTATGAVTKSFTSGAFTFNRLGGNESQNFQGVFTNLQIGSRHNYTGLGGAATAWNDTVGSNNGTPDNLVLFTGQTVDGFVSKWYDQSVTTELGNVATGNHAFQATPASQPKIVNAGSLNTSGGLEFDGSDDFFSLTSSFSFQNKAGCVFSLQDGQSSSNNFTAGTSNNNRGIGFRNIQTRWFYTTGAIDIDHSISVSGETLFTALHDGTTNNPNVTAFIDGSLAVDASPDANQGEANVSTAVDQIGARQNLSFLTGTVKEIIIYDTDQTDNRAAIEANIGEAYSITGIPAYDDTVDGFVETWYDQSGNGRDAAQATAGSQPKIVEGGLLLNELDFDGTDDFLSSSNIGAYQSSDGIGFFCAYSKHAASTSDSFTGTNPQYLLQLRKTNLSDTTFSARVLGGKLNIIRANGAGNTFLTTTSNAHTIGTNLVLSSVTGTQGVDLFEDGSELALSTDESGVSFDSSSTNLIIGSQDGGTRFIDGNIKELILYTSDQSANRPAIDANIKNQYEIT